MFTLGVLERLPAGFAALRAGSEFSLEGEKPMVAGIVERGVVDL